MEAPLSTAFDQGPNFDVAMAASLLSAPLFFLGPTSYENVYSTVNGKKIFSLVKIGAAASSSAFAARFSLGHCCNRSYAADSHLKYRYSIAGDAKKISRFERSLMSFTFVKE
jgi:hypothetical protein